MNIITYSTIVIVSRKKGKTNATVKIVVNKCPKSFSLSKSCVSLLKNKEFLTETEMIKVYKEVEVKNSTI